MPKAILEAREVVMDLGKSRILDGLSLEIWPGHIHAIIGPNGAGKSTLASTIMGLEGYGNFSGDILFEGESIKGLSIDERARKGITLAWQEPARFEGLTVKRFIKAGAKSQSTRVVREALEQVGLDAREYMTRAVDRTLSGGERKRIELASILAMEPKLVMMDEPDSGIDVEALEKILDAIVTLKEKGTTVLLITHSSTVLKRVDHAFLMCHGKLLQKGLKENIMEYFDDKCIQCDHPNQPELEIINE